MKKGIFKVYWTITFLVGVVGVAAGESWEWISPKPQGNPLAAVAYGNGKFLAVGNYGTVLSSTNGTNWIVGNRLGVNNFNRIAFGAGKFLASATYGGGFWSTTDGTTWTPVKLPRTYSTLQVHDTTFGDGKFWTVADFDLYSSTNGVDWNFETNYAGNSILHIAYANDRLVAISGNTSYVYNTLAVSNRLSVTNLPLPGVSIAAGNGFFAVGASSGGYVLTSTNGTNWNSVKALPDDSSLSTLAFGGGRFVGTTRYEFVSSTDLTNWTTPSNVFGDTYGLGFGADAWVGVGDATLAFSQDGITWTNLTDFNYNFFHSIAYTTNGFVAAGEQGLVKVLPAGSQQLQGWTDGILINAVGDLAGQTIGVGINNSTGAGLVMNLTTHSTLRSFLNVFLQDFLVVGNDIVAVGSGGTIVKRINNVWTTQTIQDAGNLDSIAHGPAGYVVGGDSGVVLYSANGSQWTTQQLGTDNFRGAAFGKGRYVLASQFGQFLVSTNGTNWSSASKFTDVVINVKYFGQGLFIASGSGFFYSMDGLNWSKSSPPSPYTFYGVALGGGTIIGVSYENTALVSGALIFPEVQMSGSTFTFRALDSRWRSSVGMVQSSEDMIHWRDERILAPMDSLDTYSFQDAQATAPQRFYRVVSPSLNWQ